MNNSYNSGWKDHLVVVAGFLFEFFFFFLSQCPGMAVGAPSVLPVVFYY